MPLYEYRCPKGHLSDHSMSIADYESLVQCPDCPAFADRVFSAPEIPVLDSYDRQHRMRRRPNPGDKMGADEGKRRRPIRRGA